MLHGGGIFTYIWAVLGVNVAKYSIDGAYGYIYQWRYMVDIIFGYEHPMRVYTMG